MVPSGSRKSIGEARSGKQAFARSNAGIMGSQGGVISQQSMYSSVVSPSSQHNMDLLGSTANISSLLNQTYGDGSTCSGLSSMSGFQAGILDSTIDSNPSSVVSSEIGFNGPPSPFGISNNTSSGANNATDQLIPRPFENGNHGRSQPQQADKRRVRQKQNPVQKSSQLQEQQLAFQSYQRVLGNAVPVKLEAQTSDEQIGLQQHLPSMQSYMALKQHNRVMTGFEPMKLEQQHPDQALLLQPQQLMQLQQQYLQSRQSPQAALAQVNMLQQQHMLQQLQQQQQMLKAPSQPRPHIQSQFQHQDLPVRSDTRPVYEPGTCARRLAQYMYQQKCRPDDNNIEFWRHFVANFFSPNAKKRWCLSLYENSRLTHGVFLQDAWHCGICNCRPGRGFGVKIKKKLDMHKTGSFSDAKETTVEVLPRLFKIKYDSGTLEDLLHIDMPCEYQNANGQIVLDYAKATEESVFEQLRVIRDGQLRVIFSPDLKIISWEFCARCHEELIPRRFILPQVNQLGAAAQKYQASAQDAASNSPAPDLMSSCNAFVASALQFAKTLEVPLVNDLGHTKRYVRCLQISEVVNGMKDLVDFSLQTGMGPMESLTKFPRRASALSAAHYSSKESQQQISGQCSKNDLTAQHAHAQQSSTTNGAGSIGNSSCLSTSTSAAVGRLSHQNSMNSRTENQTNNPSSPYIGTPVQIPSTGSSICFSPAQPNHASPFASPGLSSAKTPHNTVTFSSHIEPANSLEQNPLQESSPSSEIDPNESECSVDKVLQEVLMSTQYGEVKNKASSGYMHSNANTVYGLPKVGQSSKGSGSFVGNGMLKDNPFIVGCPSGGTGSSSGASGVNLMRAALMNNLLNANGRANMLLPTLDAAYYQQQQKQEHTSRLFDGLGAVNDSGAPLFNWKSP